MQSYKIYATDTFKRLYETLDGSEKQWINKIKEQLKENVTGKILNFSWFREKKYLNKRLYFLIDENSRKILFVSFASKKEQQKIIDFIKTNINNLLSYLKNLPD